MAKHRAATPKQPSHSNHKQMTLAQKRRVHHQEEGEAESSTSTTSSGGEII